MIDNVIARQWYWYSINFYHSMSIIQGQSISRQCHCQTMSLNHSSDSTLIDNVIGRQCHWLIRTHAMMSLNDPHAIIRTHADNVIEWYRQCHWRIQTMALKDTHAMIRNVIVYVSCHCLCVMSLSWNDALLLCYGCCVTSFVWRDTRWRRATLLWCDIPGIRHTTLLSSPVKSLDSNISSLPTNLRLFCKRAL